MLDVVRSRRATSLVLGGALAAASLLLWVAPAERTLGEGIKLVYLHVALIWTGMTGIALAGLAGVGAAASGRERLQTWGQSLGWVGLVFYAAGLGLSLLAAEVNWGGVFWAEPRTSSGLSVMAAGVAVQIVNGWPVGPRLAGLLRVLPVVLLAWSSRATPLVLHPRDPIHTSSSPAIQATFVGLFGLCLLTAGWIVLRAMSGRGGRGPGPARTS